jgi:hypothetical protein
MSSIEYANQIGHAAFGNEPAHPGSDPVAKLRTRIFYGFGGTMALGLSLAGWYVGGRILAAEQPVPAKAAVTANQPAIQTVPAADVPQKALELPNLPAPEKFLEVEGLGVKQDALFVRRLRAKGLHARIEIGPGWDSRRILIGPFEGQSAVEKVERKLQMQGILALERTY